MKMLFLNSSTLLLIFIGLFFTSCTKEEDCPNAPIVLQLTGYQFEDIDTLTLSKYTDNSNFTYLLSTIIIDPSKALYSVNNDTIQVRLIGEDDKIQSGNEWILSIPATNQELRLKNFTYEKRTHTVHTSGIAPGMDRFPDYCFSPLRSVIINGNTKTFTGEQAVIELRK